MTCAAVDSPVEATTKRCRGCGIAKALAAFSVSPAEHLGVDSRCRDCRSAYHRRQRRLERDHRLPNVLGVYDAEMLSTGVLGVLRTVYDGRPARLLGDLRSALQDSDATTRINAGLTLLALREIADLARQVSLRDDPMAALQELPDVERIAIARRLLPAGWTVAPPV